MLWTAERLSERASERACAHSPSRRARDVGTTSCVIKKLVCLSPFAPVTVRVYVTQAFKIRRCTQRRRVGVVRHPVKSIGPMQCTVLGRECARSTSNSKAIYGIYVIKPETHRPPRQPCCCEYSPSPPLAARGRPCNSGASAIQEALLRGPLEVLSNRTYAQCQRPARRIARAPCVQRGDRQRPCRADARAQSDPTAATPAAARAVR